MDDFLYNLRLNMEKRNNASADRKSGNRKRKDESGKSAFWENLNEGLSACLPEIQKHLANIAGHRSRLAEAQARHALAEQRKADALETIARDIKSLFDPAKSKTGRNRAGSDDTPESSTPEE